LSAAPGSEDEKYPFASVGSGEEIVRREAVDAEREICWLREKKRRVEPERFTGAGLGTAGERGGDMGLRRSLRRWIAASQRVQGWWWDSPMWPQPLLYDGQNGCQTFWALDCLI
jgi:hypothetical protein